MSSLGHRASFDLDFGALPRVGHQLLQLLLERPAEQLMVTDPFPSEALPQVGEGMALA
jgi:hypothetical protein